MSGNLFTLRMSRCSTSFKRLQGKLRAAFFYVIGTGLKIAGKSFPWEGASPSGQTVMSLLPFSMIEHQLPKVANHSTCLSSLGDSLTVPDFICLVKNGHGGQGHRASWACAPVCMALLSMGIPSFWASTCLLKPSKLLLPCPLVRHCSEPPKSTMSLAATIAEMVRNGSGDPATRES